MRANARRWIGQGYRRAALPLGCYYTMTLLVPLANGASASDAGFVNHAVIVATVPLVLIVLAAVLGGCVQLAARAVPLRWTVSSRMSRARDGGAGGT